MPPTGDLAHNPGVCRDWESNWRPFGLQAGTPSTEPHQSGLEVLIIVFIVKMLKSGVSYTLRLNSNSGFLDLILIVCSELVL